MESVKHLGLFRFLNGFLFSEENNFGQAYPIVNLIEERSTYHVNGHVEVLPLYMTCFFSIIMVPNFLTHLMNSFCRWKSYILPLYITLHAFSALQCNELDRGHPTFFVAPFSKYLVAFSLMETNFSPHLPHLRLVRNERTLILLF